MRRLTSVTEVIDALGGDEKVAELTHAKPKAVWNWHGYFEAFPSDTYAVMERELRRRGYSAPPHLWKMRGFEKPNKRAA